MSLDSVSWPMIEPFINGAAILCLGYPDMPKERGHLNTVNEFRSMGALVVDVVDVIAHRGMERIVDLNEPQVWPRRYDLVINPGTLEHCFNIGQAWESVWDVLNIGGRVMHVMPATMLNHGFWNVSPIAVKDWCEANGGKVLDIDFAVNGTQERVRTQTQKQLTTGRHKLPPEVVMYALCQKIKDGPSRWPAQGAYRR